MAAIQLTDEQKVAILLASLDERAAATILQQLEPEVMTNVANAIRRLGMVPGEERKKALAENTLKRIARGLRRFVIESPKPFIVNMAHGGKVEHVDAPLSTIATERGGCRALVVPMITKAHSHGWDKDGGPSSPADKPMWTVVAKDGSALVAAFLAKHYGERNPGEVMGSSLFNPIGTVTPTDHHSLVAAHLEVMHGTSTGRSVADPMPAVLSQGNHLAAVKAFLVAYYGNEKDGADLFDPMRTITARDRFGLVTVEGQDYAIADIGMRMLAMRELYRAQGFPDSYRIDIAYNGKPLTKEAQGRMVGNSVVPHLARDIVAANLTTPAMRAAA